MKPADTHTHTIEIVCKQARGLTAFNNYQKVLRRVNNKWHMKK